MKNIFQLVMVAVLGILSACGENDDYYVTNNILEADIINLQSEVPGKVVTSKIERGINIQKGEVIAIIDTSIIYQELQTLYAKREGLGAKKSILRSNAQILNENIAYFRKQTNKWDRLAKNQAGPQQRVDDFKHQLKISRLQKAELEQQIKAIIPENNGLNAQIKKIRETLDKYSIKSPISGQIIDKYINPGEIVGPGVPLGQIANEKKLHVYLYWPIDMMSQFKIGSQIELFVDGVEESFKGSISWVSPKAEFTPKIVQSAENRAQMAYQVRIELNNEEGKLKIGQPIEARLPWTAEND